MSLLEDIFLQDEANEARELERVIEGDEYDERPRSLSPSDNESGNEKRDDEAEEDKRRVDPASTKPKRVTKNPRFILNPARLTGPRGIQVIPEHFKDFRFKGKGHEKEDLDIVLKKLEHWAYRLYPKFQFQDCLKKIETLGKKRPVMVHLTKIRTDQFLSEETVVQKDSSDDEAQPPQEEDEFDKLLQQQIDLARTTPGPGSVKKVVDRNEQWARVLETPNREDRSRLPMPKATSSPSISDEQKERMIRNRKLAEERRLARLKNATSMDNNPITNTIIEVDENEPANTEQIDPSNIVVINEETEIIPKKSNRSNIIDSSDSDDDCNVMAVNESVVVDVHNSSAVDKEDNNKNINDKAEIVSDDKLEEITEVDDHNEIQKDKEGYKENEKSRVSVDGDVVKMTVDDVNDIIARNVDNTPVDVTNHTVDADKNSVEHNIINEDNNERDKINSDSSNKTLGNGSNTGTIDVQINNLTANNKIDCTSQLEVNDEITKDTREESPKPTINDIQHSEKITEDIMDVDFSDDF